jgi:hypothetical protein
MPQYSHAPFRVKDVAASPNERLVIETNGFTTSDYGAVYGGHLPHEPFRLGSFQINWSGLPYWQTWDDLAYTPGYRAYITQNQGQDTIALLLNRNQAAPISPAPIAIQRYAISTQQVYQGGGSGY